MGHFKMAKRVGLFERFDINIRKIAGVVSALAVIIGGLAGISSWASQKFANSVSEQISDFREEVKRSDEEQNKSITRLELMNLIQNDPTNVAAIEKIARYYFHTLNGDWYATQKYSDWCNEYGGDPTIILGAD